MALTDSSCPNTTGERVRRMVGVGYLAGIGFTMSLFVASLGFGEGALIEAAKIGILGASLIAVSIAFLLLRRGSPSLYHAHS